LIGGSLGLAVLRNCAGVRLRVWSRPGSVARAADVFPFVTSDVREAVDGVDLVVMCVPVGAMRGLAEAFGPCLGSAALVTDAASVKGAVMDSVGEMLGARFVGAHPMAGSEKSGLGAARADLFEGAVCVVTPGEGCTSDAVGAVTGFWRSVGCRTVAMDAATHDRLVARASHLPHAVACVLVEALAGLCPEAFALAGTGFRDTTRVAGGPAAMWAEILMQNRDEVLAALSEFRGMLGEFEAALRGGSEEVLAVRLRAAAAAREKLS
jgi:prephenate dehydrogenase